MKFQISISHKMVGFMLVVSVLPLILLQIVSYRAVLQTRMDLAKAYNAQLLEIQSEYVTLQTDQIESLAENPAWAKEIERLPATSGKYGGIQVSYDVLARKARIGQLLSGYSNMNGLESIDLYNANGAYHRVGENPADLHEDATELAHQMLRASESKGQTVWLRVGDERPGLSGKGPQYIAIKSIYKSIAGDPKPELLGMLRVNLSVGFITDHFNALNLGEGAYLILDGGAGRMIYHPNKTLIGQPLPSNLVHALVGPSGSILTSLDGEQVLLSYLQIPDKKWTLLSVIPQSTLTAPLIPIQRTSVAVLLVCLLAIAWFTRMYLRRVVLPIRDVSNGFRDFQSNMLALDWRLPQPQAWIQIGDLVMWFNAFLDSVQLQRQSSLELQASEERYRAAFLFSRESINITRLVDGCYLDVNDAFTRMTGWTRDEAIGKTSLELGLWRTADERQKFVDTLRRDGFCEDLQLDFIVKDGRAITTLFSAHNQIFNGERCMVSVTHDITKRIQDEESLRIAAIAFESELGMTITNAERTIVRVNKAFTRITGYSAEEAVGRTPSLLSSGTQSAEFYDAMNKSIQRDGSWQGEIWNRRKSGEIYPVWLSIATVKDDDGNITNYVGSHHDISDLRRAEDALRVLNRELTESRGNLRAMASQREVRLEQEKKHIAREVHDELGQILTALRMNLSMCVKDHGSVAPGLALELKNMKKLVDQAIGGVRNVAANLRPVALDMGPVAAIEWLGSEFSKRMAIPCTITVQPGSCQIDETRSVAVFRIVQESLTNIARHAQATQVDIQLDCLGKALRLEVRDNGRGFLVNTRGDRKSFGLLGMRERSLALGGTLDINSTPGLGTVVVVLMPLNDEPTEKTLHDSSAHSR